MYAKIYIIIYVSFVYFIKTLLLIDFHVKKDIAPPVSAHNKKTCSMLFFYANTFKLMNKALGNLQNV